MKNTLVFAAVASFGLTGSAFAGSLAPVVSEPMPAAPMMMPAVDAGWTGGYVGASLGYGTGDAASDLARGDLDGFGGSAFAGYQYDFGSYVLGGELEYVVGSISDDTGSFEFDNGARAKVRVGYDAGQTLVYGLIGYTMADASFAGDAIEAKGIAFGAGVDYRMTDTITLGGEIVHDRFDNFNDDITNEADVTTVSVRASYNF